jgi:tRNA 2-thiouridine synthesizing protein A
MPTLSISHTIDARGLSCPMPIVKTAQVCRVVAADSLVELLATDPGSTKDVAAWCRATGNELVEQSIDGSTYRFVIRRK